MKALCTIALWLFTSFAFAAGTVWIDVRTPQEFQSWHKAGAVNIPHQLIAQRITELGLDKGDDINLYCRSGHRAGIALNVLEAEGYTHVKNIGGLRDALKYQGK